MSETSLTSVLKPATKRQLVKHYGRVSASKVGYFQGDLMDMASYGKYNRGYKYGFVVIDVYSRYGWVVPIKTKDQAYLGVEKWLSSKAMKLYKDEWNTFVLHVDEGSEFLSSFSRVLNENEIRIKRVNSTITHQVVAERFIRTVKERIREVFFDSGEFDWISYIKSIVREYNHSVHRMIGTKPVKVFLKIDSPIVKTSDKKIPKNGQLEVGDHVRTIVIKNRITDKPSLTNNWSEKVYEVVSYIGNNYTLDDGKTYQRWKLLKIEKERSRPLHQYDKQVRAKQIKHKKEVSHKRFMEREIGFPMSFIEPLLK